MSSDKNADWWRGAVIYQVYPRSFSGHDRRRQRRPCRHYSRLAHIASLGVDAIWLSPFFKSPMADMGYDVSDYCAVDPMFGTMEDFDALVAEAHRLGLKIIIDQVLSHTSDQHPWFVESRAEQRRTTRPTGMSGPIRSRTAPRPTTGCRFSAARPGNGTRSAGNTTCTISWPRSPTSTSTIRRCRMRCSTRCASGWSAASTGSGSTR